MEIEHARESRETIDADSGSLIREDHQPGVENNLLDDQHLSQ